MQNVEDEDDRAHICDEVNVIVLRRESYSDGEDETRERRKVRRKRRQRSLDYCQMPRRSGQARTMSLRESWRKEGGRRTSRRSLREHRCSDEGSRRNILDHSRSPSIGEWSPTALRVTPRSSEWGGASLRVTPRSSCDLSPASLRLTPRSSRKSSYTSSSARPVESGLVEEEKRRRRAVCIVVAMFAFLCVCSVLAVVVTLTHRSEVVLGNKTVLVYTFSKPSLGSHLNSSA